MSQWILGIDLGTYSVKTALIERQFNEFVVRGFYEYPISSQSRLPHHEAVALALEHFSKENEIPEIDVVSTSLPGHLISDRIISFPSLNVKNLAQMVEFELEAHIPKDLDELITDYHVLEQGAEQSQILSVYLQEENLGNYLDALSDVDFDPKYMGSDLIDLSNISQVAMLPRDNVYALCDIGHSKTNICIMEGQKLRYSRTIGIGGIHFTKAVQRAFNLNYDKAEALKLSRGKIIVRDEESDQVSRILMDVAFELTANIKQTFFGYDNLYGQDNKFAIYCTGGGAKLVGLLDFISFQLRMNVLELDPLTMVPHHISNPEDSAHIMTQALANAIRPIYSNRLPKVNFRKGIYSYKQDIQVLTKELKSVGVIFVFILLLGVGYYFYADAYYSKRIATLEDKIEDTIREEYPDFQVSPSRNRSKRAKGKLDRYLRTAKSRLSTVQSQIQEVAGGEFGVLEIMEEISKKLPEKSEITFEVSELVFSEDFIRLKARTNDPRNPNKILAALKQSELLSDIESTDAKQKPNDVYDFTIKINLKKDEE